MKKFRHILYFQYYRIKSKFISCRDCVANYRCDGDFMTSKCCARMMYDEKLMKEINSTITNNQNIRKHSTPLICRIRVIVSCLLKQRARISWCSIDCDNYNKRCENCKNNKLL